MDSESDEGVLFAGPKPERPIDGARRRLQERRKARGDHDDKRADTRAFLYAMEFGKFPELLDEEPMLQVRAIGAWINADLDDDPVTIWARVKQVDLWIDGLKGDNPTLQAIMFMTDVIVSELALRRTEIYLARLEPGDPATKTCIRLIECHQRRRNESLRSLQKLHVRWSAAPPPTHGDNEQADSPPNSAAKA